MRYLSLFALFWPKVVAAISRARGKGIIGNTRGEGTLLGGLIVVDKEKIWFEHREDYFGDLVIIEELQNAIKAAQTKHQSATERLSAPGRHVDA